MRVANVVSPSPGSDVAGYSFASVKARDDCAASVPQQQLRRNATVRRAKIEDAKVIRLSR
jgi:hypothetical protein